MERLGELPGQSDAVALQVEGTTDEVPEGAEPVPRRQSFSRGSTEAPHGTVPGGADNGPSVVAKNGAPGASSIVVVVAGIHIELEPPAGRGGGGDEVLSGGGGQWTTGGARWAGALPWSAGEQCASNRKGELGREIDACRGSRHY